MTAKLVLDDGRTIDLGSWLTIANHCKQHGKKPSTVMARIQRSVIPADKVVTIPELNNMKLLRNELYKL